MTGRTPITDDQWRAAFASASTHAAAAAMVGRSTKSAAKAAKRIGLKPSAKPQRPAKPQPAPRAVLPPRPKVTAADRAAIDAMTPPPAQRAVWTGAQGASFSTVVSRQASVTLWAPFDGRAW